MTTEEPAPSSSSSSSKIFDIIESGILHEKKERKEERKEKNEEEIEAFKSGRSSMKTGRSEDKMKESNLATTRDIIYLHKPGWKQGQGPLRPLLNLGHLRQRHRHLHPQHHHPLLAGVRGLARGAGGTFYARGVMGPYMG
jgi:hypothetical protein